MGKVKKKGFSKRDKILIRVTVYPIFFVLCYGFLIPFLPRSSKGSLLISAKNELTTLVTSIDCYYATYNVFPTEGVDYPDQDKVVSSTGPVMAILAGVDLEGKNSKEIPFFTGDEARGTRDSNARAGLLRRGAMVKLFDPWKKKGEQERGYLILLDYDGDGYVEDPFHPGKKIPRRVVAWSTGKDGKWKPGDPKKGVNKDNVYSWF